jgi:cobyrinic acid a,c-diamide synthase
MQNLPRIAVGTAQSGVESRPMLWALLSSLRRQGIQVQSFFSQATFAGFLGEAAVAGRNPRHLDSWLMTPNSYRSLFARGSRNCDLAVVEGAYDPARGESRSKGGSLDALCQWLDLPRIVILDAVEIERHGLPERPSVVDGLLLDRAADDERTAALTAVLASQWNTPVLAALPELADLRGQIRQLGQIGRPSRDLCSQLADAFLRYADTERITEIAARRGQPWKPPYRPEIKPYLVPTNVAIAYDDAINLYFPDVLDSLDSLGANIVDFSLLHDERLPEEIDVVYLGCGHPELYAAQLSHNHCMKLALRNHLRTGGRIYAEGGSLAYLCQQMETADGNWWRMAGIFPAVARFNRQGPACDAVAATFSRATWLSPIASTVRGYRNPNWRLEPLGLLSGCVAPPGNACDIVRSCHAIGSQLNLDLAADEKMLGNFFQNRLPRFDTGNPWLYAPRDRGLISG